MIRVFLVEDESTIRETLKSSVPWEACGYTFAGEASDGEMALPLIRTARPDVLITDIRMPFMDGLSLSKLVLKEFPDIRIIIISGYDDFEYARQAVEIGAEQYLLKPITKAALVKVLDETREKIEQEQAESGDQDAYRQDSQEYEQFARRRFIEKVVAGRLSVQQIYEEAAKLELDMSASGYAIAFFSALEEKYTDADARISENILGFFMKRREYVLIRWNINTYMVLIKGDADHMDSYIQECIAAVESGYAGADRHGAWYVAVAGPVERLSSLPGCFEEVSRLWAYRYIQQETHILTERTVGSGSVSSASGIDDVDAAKFNPNILIKVMSTAAPEEIPNFVSEFLIDIKSALNSHMFCQYLMLSARFTATEYVGNLGVTKEKFLEGLDCLDMIEKPVTEKELKYYLTEILIHAVKLRMKSTANQYRDVMGQAIAYIDRHYTDEDLSLNQVAKEVNISPNYFSAVFSQEMKCTFVEYVTSRRMDKAKMLLRTTDRKSGDIALEVGYKDPHYFSFLFKKTQDCTPRDYRTGGKRE
ncbi:two-component system, response regulator YesN [Lachnospiraceae bacterium XPB1003]|nr:two-component system, response regulator YesN [Lachnospiraceae bacterium XPB1003]